MIRYTKYVDMDGVALPGCYIASANILVLFELSCGLVLSKVFIMCDEDARLAWDEPSTCETSPSRLQHIQLLQTPSHLQDPKPFVPR